MSAPFAKLRELQDNEMVMARQCCSHMVGIAFFYRYMQYLSVVLSCHNLGIIGQLHCVKYRQMVINMQEEQD